MHASSSQPMGLRSSEASERLRRFGPNLVEEKATPAWRLFVGKFWTPIPWMLEVTIVLELMLGRWIEAGIIALLLVFNAVLSFLQEARSNRALALVKAHLLVQARVLRDARWQSLPARELVPDDVIHVRSGDILPADAHLLDGQIELDQSMLTGESLPVEVSVGGQAFAGAVVKRGEATAKVSATGARTTYGRTTELLQSARTATHLEQVILTIVRYMALLDLVLVAGMVPVAIHVGIPFGDVLPFALILLVASVPAALPATFTLAASRGALELARRGVLITRLSAIEEAAAVDVFCTDKTGTITRNQLAIAQVLPYAPYLGADVLRLAALASDEATQDPIDLAVLHALEAQELSVEGFERLRFLPFEPETKRTEALVKGPDGQMRISKGASGILATLLTEGAEAMQRDTERLASLGHRVIAVVAASGDRWKAVGLLAMRDPPRDDSALLVTRLRELGIRVIMVTGDGLETARAIAREVGIGNRACSADAISQAGESLDCDVFARVLPDEKYRLVRRLQEAHHVVGMTGDGVNDAPALKQAEVGVAVANATDIAKSAASLVLTQPGLGNILDAVETSRRIYQRMLTYTLNKIIKTFEIAIFLSVSLIVTQTMITTPVLVVLLLFTNDFVTMAIATDRTDFSRKPDRWVVRSVILASFPLAMLILVIEFAIFLWARSFLPLPQLQTLVFFMLVLTGQGTIHLVRERRHFWRSRPGLWLLVATILDLGLVSLMATKGVLMAPVPGLLLLLTGGVLLAYLVAVDFAKVRIFDAVLEGRSGSEAP